MTGLFYLMLFLVVGFVLAFVGYYTWRLLQLRAARDESDRRMQTFMRELQTTLPTGQGQTLPQGLLPQSGAPQVTPPPSGGAGPPLGIATPLSDAVPVVPDSAPPDGGLGVPTRVYERRVALRALSPSPVFLTRDRAGEVTIQIESRPPMPLKYVLDARARQVLQDVATVATVELGDRWSVLASEDEQGRLVLARLA